MKCGNCKLWKPSGTMRIESDGSIIRIGWCRHDFESHEENHLCHFGNKKETNMNIKEQDTRVLIDELRLIALSLMSQYCREVIEESADRLEEAERLLEKYRKKNRKKERKNGLDKLH